MAFFLKTRSTNKITPLDQKFTLRKIRLVFLFLNLFSHMKNLFSVYYRFKKILKERKVTILSLRTGDRLIYKSHKIICFTVLTMKNPKIQVYAIAKVCQLFARFTFSIQESISTFCGFIFCRFNKMRSLRTFLSKDITVQKISWFNEQKFNRVFKTPWCYLCFEFICNLARNSQIAGFFKRQYLQKHPKKTF